VSLTAAPSRSRFSGSDAVEGGSRAPWLIAVAILALIAFVLRVSQLDQTLLGDEVFTYRDIFGHSFSSVLTTVHTGGENSPPLYFLLAWATAKLGDPTVWIRVPSLVLGTAAVVVVYEIGRLTVGRVAGLIGAAVMALSPFAVFYGVEARPYATMTFFVALSTLALLRAVATRSRWWWLLYVGAAAAAAYSHYTCIFVLAAQAAWSLWACRDRLREPLIANGLIVLLYLPWLPHLRGKALAVIGGLYPLTASRVVGDLLRPIPAHPSAPLRAIPTIAGLVAVGLCVLAGLVAVSLRWWRASRQGRLRPPSGLVLLVALSVATPAGLLLYSLTVSDLWLPRGLSASMPAAALVLGALLAGLPRPLTAVAAVVVMITLLAGTFRSFGPDYARGPYRSIAAYLDRVARPADPIIYGTYAGAGAISAELKKPHLVQDSLLTPRWSLVAPGGSAYVVFDETLTGVGGIATPHPIGFVLVARKHYVGALPTDVLTYRRQLGPR
jgi:uncharacterized membrane protein